MDKTIDNAMYWWPEMYWDRRRSIDLETLGNMVNSKGTFMNLYLSTLDIGIPGNKPEESKIGVSKPCYFTTSQAKPSQEPLFCRTSHAKPGDSKQAW